MKAKLKYSTAAIVLMMTMAPMISAAQTATQYGAITGIRTGYSGDAFAVVTNSPVVNPAGCSIPDSYFIAKQYPGYDTFYKAAIAAYTSAKPVQIVVSNTACNTYRPIIIGINF